MEPEKDAKIEYEAGDDIKKKDLRKKIKGTHPLEVYV